MYPRSKTQDQATHIILDIMREPDITYTELRQQYTAKRTWQFIWNNKLLVRDGDYVKINWPVVRPIAYIVSDELYVKLADTWWRNYYNQLSRGKTDKEAERYANRRVRINKQKREGPAREYYAVRKANYKSPTQRLEQLDNDKLSIRNILFGREGGTNNAKRKTEKEPTTGTKTHRECTD